MAGKTRNPFRLFLEWLGVILLVALCLIASDWQWNKGVKLAQKNSAISLGMKIPPVQNPNQIEPIQMQWRRILLNGKFLPNYSLIKNRYFEGQYGFEVLQDFHSDSLGLIHIDRGWVKAGKDAKTAPLVPQINASEDLVLLRIRSEFLTKELSGSLFASSKSASISKTVYYDLLQSKHNPPLTNIDLPELSTGPHYAYAFQWIFFALLLVFGKIIFSRKKSNSKSD